MKEIIKVDLFQKNEIKFIKYLEQELTKGDKDNYLKINNNTAFMPLVVEIIYSSNNGYLLSLCHYGKQNGDAMRDPEVCILYRKDGENEYYTPYYFRNDYVGMEKFIIGNYCIDGDLLDSDLSHLNYNKRSHIELISFCGMWFKNIIEQQNLDID